MKLVTSNTVIFYRGQRSKTFQSAFRRSSISAPLSRTLRTCSSLSWKSSKSQNQMFLPEYTEQKEKPGNMLKFKEQQETPSEFAKLWAGEPKSGRWLGEAGEVWPLGNKPEHVQNKKTDRKCLKANRLMALVSAGWSTWWRTSKSARTGRCKRACLSGGTSNR